MTLSEIQAEIASLEPIIRRHARSDAVDRAIQRHCEWQNALPAQTSLLNHRLYFLQLVEEESDDNRLKEIEQIIDAVLEGTGIRPIGDQIEYQGKQYILSWRKIGSMYGVEMCFTAEDGSVLHREFHD